MDDADITNLIGEDGWERLVAAFYRQIPADPSLGPMYPATADALAAAERHLRDFLIYRFGGSPRYIEQRGAPRLRIRHAPFVITPAARDRWFALMDAALTECAFPSETAQRLRTFFDESATFLINAGG